MIRKALLMFSFLLPGLTGAQTPALDSMQSVLQEARHDTARLSLLISIAKEQANLGEYEQAVQTNREAQLLARKTGNKKTEALAHSNIAAAQRALGKLHESLAENLIALRLREAIADSMGIANSYNNIGLLFWGMQKYTQAHEYHGQALRIREQLGDSDLIAASHLNIGMTYYKQGIQHSKTWPAYAQDFFQSALVSYARALGYFERAQALHSMAACYNNIANVFADKAALSDDAAEAKRLYAFSLDNYFRSRNVLEKAGDRQSVVITLNNIAYIYREQGDLGRALGYARQSLERARAIGAKNEVQEAYLNLAEIAHAQRDFEHAYEYHRLYALTKDSLLNEASNRQVVEMQTKYETEKKDKELLKKDAEARQASLQRNFFIAGFVFMLVLAFLIFRGYRHKQKANLEIQRQKELVEVKQKEILDSIHYAKRIQSSLLPNEKYIQRKMASLRRQR